MSHTRATLRTSCPGIATVALLLMFEWSSVQAAPILSTGSEFDDCVKTAIELDNTNRLPEASRQYEQCWNLRPEYTAQLYNAARTAQRANHPCRAQKLYEQFLARPDADARAVPLAQSYLAVSATGCKPVEPPVPPPAG